MAAFLYLLLCTLSWFELVNTVSFQTRQFFYTLPDANPPPLDVVVNNLDVSDKDLIFLTPLDTGADGLYIYRSNGELVWTSTPRPDDPWGPANLHTVEWNGELHLAATLLPYRAKPICRQDKAEELLESSFIAPGGTNVLYNNKYEIVKTYDPPGSTSMGGHEFYTIDNGTAVVQQYFHRRTVDPERPEDFDWLLHVFNHTTGETIFKWRAMDHIAHDSVCRFFGGVKNPHTNAVDRTDDGNWIINNFGMCCAVKVDAKTGSIIWRFGGADTDFTMTDSTTFGNMHHVNVRTLDEIRLPAHINRAHLSPETHVAISFFDNAWDLVSPPTARSSSAVIVLLDLRDMTGQVIERYWHPQGKFNPIFGSLHIHTNGHRFVGWGQSGEISEYDYTGNLIYYAGLGLAGKETILSYRAYKTPWSAIPSTPPTVLSYSWACASPTVLYISWNGATSVASYRVLSAPHASGPFTNPITAPKNGFETTIWLDRFTPYVTVEALDLYGNVLGTSEVTRVRVPSARARDHCTHHGCSRFNMEWEKEDGSDECLKKMGLGTEMFFQSQGREELR